MKLMFKMHIRVLAFASGIAMAGVAHAAELCPKGFYSPIMNSWIYHWDACAGNLQVLMTEQQVLDGMPYGPDREEVESCKPDLHWSNVDPAPWNALALKLGSVERRRRNAQGTVQRRADN